MGETLASPLYTIQVDQAKEKFGELRVYCHLADNDLITNRLKYPLTEENKKLRLYSDAVYYRRTYRSMIDLVPHYRDALVHSADYSELVECDTKEDFERFFVDEMSKNFPYYHSAYQTKDNDELYRFMMKVHQ